MNGEEKGEENISDELCVRFQAFRCGFQSGAQRAHTGLLGAMDATGKLPPPWPVAVTGESRNLIQISAHASKLSYRNGSKGSFCSKAAAAWHAACACWDGRRDQSPVQCSAVTAPPPPHDHTMDMATRIFFHILPANSRFHLSFLHPSPSARYKKRRESRVVSRRREIYSTFYRVLLQSQPVSFFL